MTRIPEIFKNKGERFEKGSRFKFSEEIKVYCMVRHMIFFCSFRFWKVFWEMVLSQMIQT